jgi:hypothetical protein
MDCLDIVQNIFSTQSTIISCSTQQISAVLQGGATFTQEVIQQANKSRKKKTKHGGSRKGQAPNLPRDFKSGYQQLYQDYFSPTPIYTDLQFCQHFRMHKGLFLKIVEDIQEHNSYFTQKGDALGNLGLRGIQKITLSL